MIRSILETCACFAFKCAALNRATLCSGVSTNLGVPGILGSLGPVGEPLGVLSRGSADLELAWGVVGVKRVASETLRGFDGGAIESALEYIYRMSGLGRYVVGVEVEQSGPDEVEGRDGALG